MGTVGKRFWGWRHCRASLSVKTLLSQRIIPFSTKHFANYEQVEFCGNIKNNVKKCWFQESGTSQQKTTGLCLERRSHS